MASKRTPEQLRALRQREAEIRECGEVYTVVDDFALVAALVGIGVPQVPFALGDAVVSKRRIGGRMSTLFYLGEKTRCGSYRTDWLMAAWERDMEFIKENPTHPFSFVMIGLKNLRVLEAKVHSEARTIVGMVNPDAPADSPSVLYIFEGSRRHKIALRSGLVEI